MRRTLLPALTVTALLLMGGLSGCSAAIVDGAASPSGPASEVDEPVAAPSPTAPAQSDSPDDGAASGLSPENAEERARFAAGATTTMPCPSGALDQDGAIIRVEGSCTDLVIEIDAGVVIADDVENLTLAGSGTVVYAETIGALTVTGSASVVHWTGATPTVDDRGSANTLTRG